MAVPHSAQAQQQGAQEQDSLTYERLSSALGDLGTQAQMLGQLDAQNVRVVDIENVMSNLDDTQRQKLREMYENVETEALHDAIENSPTINDALKNEAGTQYDASDVVAIDMQEGGHIVAYVDPSGTLRGGTGDVQEGEEAWQDRDTTEAGDMQQRDEQQEDRDPFETGEAQQQDAQTFERLHSAMHDMKKHTQALTQTGAEQMEDQPMDDQQAETQNIRVVNVGDIMSDLDDTQRQRLRRTYQDAETDELHSVLENNESVQNALRNNADAQVEASDVVAVDVREGETVVYVDPDGELMGEESGDFEQRGDTWEESDTTEAGDMQERDDQEQDPFDTGEAQQQGSQTFERLHSAMHDMKKHTQALTQTGAEQMEDQPMDDQQAETQNIRVVNVGDIMSDLDDTQRQRLRRTYQDAETDELHSVLENNESVQNALRNNADAQVEASDVVAVDVREGGETVVYVDPDGELMREESDDFEQRDDTWEESDTSEIGGRQQRDAQQRGRDTSEAQEFDQQEAQERDRDTSETAGFDQQEAQQRDRNTYETGDAEEQRAGQQDPQTFEGLHSSMHEIKTHAQALTRTGAQGMDAQRIRVVNVEDITSDLDDTQLQRLRTTYENAETEVLHRAVQNSEAINNSLSDYGEAEVDAGDVVAVNVQENGETIVYVDPNGELEGNGADGSQQQ